MRTGLPFLVSASLISSLLFPVIGVQTSAAQGTETSSTPPKRVVADYGYWSKYQTPSYGAAQIPFKKLTHVLHAGVNIGGNADGTLDVPQGFLEPKLIRKAHASGVKVMLLVGGDPSVFSQVAADDGLRELLVSNLFVFALQNGYDGVDIDWEYPAETDRKAFYELMSGLRGVFASPTYQISADVAPWGGIGYSLANVGPVVDFLNVMMFDCAGPWTDDAQLNSPIFWDHHDPEPWECEPGGSVDQAIDIYQRHVPVAKLNMATPFYGYFYRNVSQLFGNCPNAPTSPDQSCDNSEVLTENYGTFIKQRINQKGWQTYYDPIALVPYMLRTDGKPGFITYDDQFSTFYRVWYSDWQRGLGGTFMWSVDADYDGLSQDLLDSMYLASQPPGN